jgi:hypothetical protein
MKTNGELPFQSVEISPFRAHFLAHTALKTPFSQIAVYRVLHANHDMRETLL